MNLNLKKLKDEFSGDISNNKWFCVVTYAVLGFVGLVMTILNIITDKGFLTECTGAFAILCVVNVVLTLPGKFYASFAKFLFAIEVLAMFTFFLVSGNPEGFSAIWICMLPSIGMFFFNRFRGTIICVAMFFILVFLLWTSPGNSLLMYSYTETFKMRFPILFVAFHLLAFLLETLRAYAYTEMKKMQAYYKDLSVRDQLTQVFNRQGMYSLLESKETDGIKKVGIAMFDIDHFKDVNDTYGHNAGDTVLKEFAQILTENLNAVICRWGGEEFVAICFNGEVDTENLSKVKNIIEGFTFNSEDKPIRLSASIGFCIADSFSADKIDQIIENADIALYKAKNEGRNKIVDFSELSENNA